MFKIVGLAEYDGQIERFDDDSYASPIFYVRVGGEGHRSEHPAIWRAEAPPKWLAGSSLLYVWVRRPDGSIRDIEFVCIRQECIQFVSDEFEFLNGGAQGLPIADLNLWEGPGVAMWGNGIWPAVSESLPLRLFVGNDAYSLQIGDPTDTSEVISFDQFRVGLDGAGMLRRIDVVNVSAEKIEAIRKLRDTPPSGLPPTKGGLPRRLRWELNIRFRRLRWRWLLRRSA